MASDRSISVEVLHAAKDGALFRERVRLSAGSTVADAIAASGFADRFPDVPVDDANVGVFSRKTGLCHVLDDDDRVEIYRPLAVTPNEARKLRARRRQEKSERLGS